MLVRHRFEEHPKPAWPKPDLHTSKAEVDWLEVHPESERRLLQLDCVPSVRERFHEHRLEQESCPRRTHPIWLERKRLRHFQVEALLLCRKPWVLVRIFPAWIRPI